MKHYLHIIDEFIMTPLSNVLRRWDIIVTSVRLRLPPFTTPPEGTQLTIRIRSADFTDDLLDFLIAQNQKSCAVSSRISSPTPPISSVLVDLSVNTLRVHHVVPDEIPVSAMSFCVQNRRSFVEYGNHSL
jgi:hypothetical protein